MEGEARCDTPSDDSPWSAVHFGWHHGEAGILLHRSLHQDGVRCHQLPVSSVTEYAVGGVVGVDTGVGVDVGLCAGVDVGFCAGVEFGLCAGVGVGLFAGVDVGVGGWGGGRCVSDAWV